LLKYISKTSNSGGIRAKIGHV